MLAAEPTQIRFPRKISSLAIIENGRCIPLPVQESGKESTLEIDDQLVQYVVEVTLTCHIYLEKRPKQKLQK